MSQVSSGRAQDGGASHARVAPRSGIATRRASRSGSVCQRPNSLPSVSLQTANQPMLGTGYRLAGVAAELAHAGRPALMSSTSKYDARPALVAVGAVDRAARASRRTASCGTRSASPGTPGTPIRRASPRTRAPSRCRRPGSRSAPSDLPCLSSRRRRRSPPPRHCHSIRRRTSGGGFDTERRRRVRGRRMEPRGLEPLTFWLPARRSPS